jgi:hypothetical protein
VQQSAVAALMAAVAAQQAPEFVISTGDNAYPHGLSSHVDRTFNKSFTAVYHHPALQVSLLLLPC